LCRVYAQIGNVFYYQGLYRQELVVDNLSEYYAWKGKDTLAALLNYEKRIHAYRKLNMSDSVIQISYTSNKLYTQYGYPDYAAVVLSYPISTLIETGKMSEAKKNMDIYESKSGFFDSLGNIVHGREIYYKVKGYYYLGIEKFDSAEYFFRKELCCGKDFNNQNAGAKGLADLFQILHKSDSAAKYYQYAYAMNDSLFAHTTTETVERMHAMYDYSNYQEIARKKTEEAREERLNRQIAIGSIVFIVLFFSFVTYFLIRKEKKGLKKYLSILQELKQMRYETKSLKLHETEYRKLILEKEERIAELEKYASKYGKQLYFTTANAERCLHESVTYKRIAVIAARGQRLTDTDWKDISMIIAEYLPGFEDFMEVNRPQLKANEYPLCILLRMHFKAVEIAGMLNLSKSQVSQLCSDIMRKVFDKKGSSKELSANLSKIF
jgi:hypothetical protein